MECVLMGKHLALNNISLWPAWWFHNNTLYNVCYKVSKDNDVSGAVGSGKGPESIAPVTHSTIETLSFMDGQKPGPLVPVCY